MPRWTISHARWLALTGVAGLSIVAVLSYAAPLSAQTSSAAQPSTTDGHHHMMAGPSLQHDHAVQQATPGAKTSVETEITRLLARIDETTGDERMAVMTELIMLLVQDRAAHVATAGTAPAGMLMSAPCAADQTAGSTPMCTMCADHQAAGAQMCAMCAGHQAAGAQMCAMCADHQAAGNGQMCAMCASHQAGASDQAAGAPASPSCCASHK